MMVQTFEEKKKIFNVDECVAYVKGKLTWVYFKKKAYKLTNIPGVGPRARVESSTRHIFQSLMREVIEKTIDEKYAKLNSWDKWSEMVLEPRLAEEERLLHEKEQKISK